MSKVSLSRRAALFGAVSTGGMLAAQHATAFGSFPRVKSAITLPTPTIQTIEPSAAWDGTDAGALTVASMVPNGTGLDQPAVTWVDVQGTWINADGMVTGVLGSLNDREGLRYVEYRILPSTTWTRVTDWSWDARTKLPLFPIIIRSRSTPSGSGAQDGDIRIEARCVPVNGLERIIVQNFTLNTKGTLPRPAYYLDSSNPNASDTLAIGSGGGTLATPFKTITGAQIRVGTAGVVASGAIVYTAGGQTYTETTVGPSPAGVSFGTITPTGGGIYTVPRLVEFVPDPAKPGQIYVKRPARFPTNSTEAGYFHLRLTRIRLDGMTFEMDKSIMNFYGGRLDTTTPADQGVKDITWFSNCKFLDPDGTFGPANSYPTSNSQNMLYQTSRISGTSIRFGPRYAITESVVDTIVFCGATFERNNSYKACWDLNCYSGNIFGSAKLNVRADLIGDWWQQFSNFAGPQTFIGAQYAPNVTLSSDGLTATWISASGLGGYYAVPPSVGDVAKVYWSPVSADIGKTVTITSVTVVSSVQTAFTISGGLSASGGQGALFTVPNKVFPITQLNVLCDGSAGSAITSENGNQAKGSDNSIGGGQNLRTLVLPSTNGAGQVAGKVSTNGRNLTFYDVSGNPAPTRAIPGYELGRGDQIRIMSTNDRLRLYSLADDAKTGQCLSYLTDEVVKVDYAIDVYPLRAFSANDPASDYKIRTSGAIIANGDLVSFLAGMNTDFVLQIVAHGDLGQFTKGAIGENIVWYNYFGTAASAQFFLMQTLNDTDTTNYFRKFNHVGIKYASDCVTVLSDTGLTIAADGVTCSLSSWTASTREGDPGVGDLVTVGSITKKIVSVSSPTSFVVEAGIGQKSSVSWSKTCTIVGKGVDSATGLETITFSSDAVLPDNSLVLLSYGSGSVNIVTGYTNPQFGDGGDTWRVAPAGFVTASGAVPATGGYDPATRTALLLPNPRSR